MVDNLLGLLLISLLLLGEIEGLLPSGLSFEDLRHDVLFIGSSFVERLAKFHDGDRSLGVTNRSHISIHFNGRQWAITDLLRVGDLVLSVVEVPHIQESIYSGEEEQTAPGLRPAAISEVSLVVSGLHDR